MLARSCCLMWLPLLLGGPGDGRGLPFRGQRSVKPQAGALSDASDQPLRTRPVVAVVGRDVVLPCHHTTPGNPQHGNPSPVTPTAVAQVLEWGRVLADNSWRTVLVVRDGKELEKEKAAEYVNRTRYFEDGSLELFRVQVQDNGTYRCQRHQTESPVKDVFIDLVVAQVSHVNVSILRTAANQLLVQCESSGWFPEPHVFVLDSEGTDLGAMTELETIRGRYSLRAQVQVTSGTFTCRVEILEGSTAEENQITITDELEERPACSVSWSCVWLCVGLGCFTLLSLIWKTKTLQLLPHSLSEWFGLRGKQMEAQPEDRKLLQDQGQTDFTDYGDIKKVDTTGASDDTVKMNMLKKKGIEASQELAEKDSEEMEKYHDIIVSVGTRLHIHPALIAGIISKQSEAGRKLSKNGFGQQDQNCFGLMQINKFYHAVKGSAFSEEHVDQGVTFLIQLIKTMRRTRADWTKEQQLKGALACYIAGEERVLPLEYQHLDDVTPTRDFSNDVVARAQWFAHHWTPHPELPVCTTPGAGQGLP